MDARIAPPFMEATDASRLVCVVVVSYQEYSLHTRLPGLSHKDYLHYWVEALELAVQFASRKP